MSVASAAGAADGDRASILVKVEPGADPDAVAARNDMAVVRYLPEIHWAEMVPLPSTGIPRGGDEVSSAQLRGLGAGVSDDPGVRSVDAASSGDRISWHYVPTDPLFKNTFVDKQGQSLPAAWHYSLTNFPVAWDSAKGTGVVVAVLDSEFSTTNPDLRDKLVNRYNVASGTVHYRSANVDPQPGDEAHGSHVGGLVGASTDNGIAVAGACFGCGVMAIKLNASKTAPVADAQFVADVSEGILYAANSGARVINMSLGGPQVHQVQADAVNYAAAKGVVIVASAGNNQETAPGQINYPSAFPNVIGVGATDFKDQIAGFSSQGSWVDVSAPGHEVVSTTSAGDEEAFEYPGSGGVLVSIKSGTSMAAPIVAGLAGLMLSARPDLNPAEVEGLMKTTARDLGIPGPDLIYGAGRIDAAAAVAAARAYVRPVPPPPPAPPVKKKVRKIGTKVSLRVKVRKGKVSYLGSIASKNKKCLKKRVVVLRAKRSSKALVQTKTTKKGGFKLSLPKRPKKRVQVVVKVKKIGPAAVCKGATSKFVN